MAYPMPVSELDGQVLAVAACGNPHHNLPLDRSAVFVR